MTWSEIADEIIANRRRRGWSSAYDLAPSLGGLLEELGELEEAWCASNAEGCIDALCDIAVYAIGAMRILRVNPDTMDLSSHGRPHGEYAHPMVRPLVRYAGQLAKAHKRGDGPAMQEAATRLSSATVVFLGQVVKDPFAAIADVVRQNATREHTGTHG